jgi:hypothetical protein
MTDHGQAYGYPASVAFQLKDDAIEDYVRAADFLNAGRFDVACLQHDFGILAAKPASTFSNCYRAGRGGTIRETCSNHSSTGADGTEALLDRPSSRPYPARRRRAIVANRSVFLRRRAHCVQLRQRFTTSTGIFTRRAKPARFRQCVPLYVVLTGVYAELALAYCDCQSRASKQTRWIT